MVSFDHRLSVKVSVTAENVIVDFADRRRETIALFGELSGEQARQFASDIWMVGLRAVARAQVQAQETRLEDIGKTLLEDMDCRLERYVDEKGTLAQFLAKYGDALTKTLETQLRSAIDGAHDKVVRGLDPLSEDSAAARFLKALRDPLAKQAESHTEGIVQILEAIARVDARRAYDQKSARGGLNFQSAVLDFVTSAVRGGPWIVDDTGNTVGLVPHSKKGDLVITATVESVFAGARIATEAKRESGYSHKRALQELDAARKNRDAGVGLFVMAKSHAAEGFPRLSRDGRNVVVVWDHEDPGTDPYLEAAIMLALGLVVLRTRVGDQGDIKALAGIQGRIEAEVSRLSKIEGFNDTIRRNSDNIAEEVRKSRQQLGGLVDKAKSVLAALNIEVVDEVAERRTPIGLPGDPPGRMAKTG